MLGELLSYVEVTRSAVLLSRRARPPRGRRRVVPRRPAARAACGRCSPTWFPRVAEIITLIGSHNLLATPSRRQLDDAALRPLIDEFLHGANGVDAEERAALFRLAWDFVGSGLAGRNLLYERFYLTSASRNRINRTRDQPRPHAGRTRSSTASSPPAAGAGRATGRDALGAGARDIMTRVMRAFLLCLAVAGLLTACGSSEKQWYKPNAEYTVTEFQRDRAACEKSGQLDEDCMRQRGWIPLTSDKDKVAPSSTPTTRSKYF